MPADRLLHLRCGHSRKVSTLTDLQFRVWVQYLLSADDFGVMRGTHHQLRADNDYLATKPPRVIQQCLDALVRVGLIHRFKHQGQPFVYQRDWQSWQKVIYPRMTVQACPAYEELAKCAASTLRLFAMHPGGGGKKYKKHGDESSLFQESSKKTSGTSARARARGSANGSYLSALEGGTGETEPDPLAAWFEELKREYPPDKVSSGRQTVAAFKEAVHSQGTADVTFARLMANLRQQKRGRQWQAKKIPRLDRWLSEGLWEQQHDEVTDPSVAADDRGHVPPCRTLTECTARALEEARAHKAAGV